MELTAVECVGVIHTAGGVCGNASCSCGGHKSVPPNSRQSWICMNVWCTEFFDTACYVCWSVKHKAIRPWSKHNRSMQTLKEMKRKYSDWISVRKAFRTWGKCKWSHRERWAALSCTELSWPEMSFTELSLAKMIWAELRWDKMRWVEIV
jgi:hypothetical protein